MNLTVDANILFSALLKDSATRSLILNRQLKLYAPRFLILEYAKYSAELRKRSGLGEKDFTEISKRIVRRIRLVSDGEIKPYYEAALGLVSDRKDAPYVACALAVGSELWSNDRHLKGIRVRNWTTKELVEKIFE